MGYNGCMKRRYFFLFGIVILSVLLVVPNFAEASMLRQAPNNLGLVGYWSFEDGSGSVATDFSGNGNSGTLTSMEAADWIGGRVGSALDLDGSAEYVDIPDNSSLTVGQPDFTFSAWLRPGDVSGCGLATSPGCIVFNKENSYEWAIAGDNTIAWAIDNSNPGWAWRSSRLTAPSNVWTHFVITYDGSNLVTYKNGGASSDSQVATGSVTENNLGLRIGARGAPGGGSSLFPGTIDEVRIYNRVLSATEILSLYENHSRIIRGNFAPKSGLAGYWSFEDATGTIATDFSGSGNDGALTNMEAGDWIDGKQGKALNFDGYATVEYVSSGSSTSLNDLADGKTFSFWLNNTTYPGGRDNGYLTVWVDDNNRWYIDSGGG